MSYSREEFEQAVEDRWSDSYSFARNRNGDYLDSVLAGMWFGWQASRQEGEPIGFLQSSGVSQLSGGHPAKLYPIVATPSPFESSTLVYTHPASAAKQAVSVPSILYDGYAVFQEVQHARNSKGLENIKDSALVSDVLDAVVKLIKQEQDDE